MVWYLVVYMYYHYEYEMFLLSPNSRKLPRKHLWLSIPSVILDMLRICWEGRTVNQAITVWCPSAKAKGQKVHENSNLCYNSPSFTCSSPLFLCMCPCMEDISLLETHCHAYFIMNTSILYTCNHIFCLSYLPLLHQFFMVEIQSSSYSVRVGWLVYWVGFGYIFLHTFCWQKYSHWCTSGVVSENATWNNYVVKYWVKL